MNSRLNLFVFSLILLIVPLVAIAAGGPGTPQGGGVGPGTPQQQGTTLINPLAGETDLMSFLRKILALVIKIGGIVVIFMLVYIGYLFATSSFVPENKEKARSAFVWTLVGALILLGAQAIATGITATVTALGV